MISPIIEYLMAQRKGRGATLCSPNRFRYDIAMPPGSQVIFTVAPPLNHYAAIKYGGTYIDEVVPGTLYIEEIIEGNMIFVGMGESDWIRAEMHNYLVFTISDPLWARVVNTSNLNQRFAGTMWSIIINTEEDMQEVNKHLDAYSAVSSKERAEEANILLKQIKDKVG